MIDRENSPRMTMRKALTPSCTALALAGLVAGPAQAQTSMKPGLWEITMTMEMPGMPMQPKPTTVRQCYRPEDVKDPKNMIPKQQDGGVKCETLDYKQSGDTASWRLACKGQGMNMTGSGNMTMKSDSYTGTSVMEMNMQGKNMKMSQKLNGKWVGECPGK
jgi:hypothetical protein